MNIPTEPIGSIPRPAGLIEAVTSAKSTGDLEREYEKAIVDTLREFEKTGSPVVTDGEQAKPSFVTYPFHGSPAVSGGGMSINFADGHSRQLPLLTRGPFRYSSYASEYLRYARERTKNPLKQAVISASALSLIYPAGGIEDYPQEEFISDLVNECEKDIRLCLEQGAHKVQMDFTEGRLSLKLDPSHVCPGADRDSTHSADVDYNTFLSMLFDLNVSNFYIQLASEPDHEKVLKTIGQYIKPNQRVFIGVIDVNSPEIESAEKVRDRILEAVKFIPLNQLGTTDDCGFAPFGDDTSTSRETAFMKIKARIDGTRLAEKELQ